MELSDQLRASGRILGRIKAEIEVALIGGVRLVVGVQVAFTAPVARLAAHAVFHGVPFAACSLGNVIGMTCQADFCRVCRFQSQVACDPLGFLAEQYIVRDKMQIGFLVIAPHQVLVLLDVGIALDRGAVARASRTAGDA